ncbi:MAG: sulfatase [Bryobacteraceae bacterium]
MTLTRRQFHAALAGAAAPAPAQPPSSKINVLLITNDQHRADCVGSYGNPVVRTPNLDALAAEGLVFDRHFVQCPQCVPSRSALHTGRYPHVNRTPSNLFRLPDSEQTLAHMLGREGYVTAAVGDMPFAPTKFLGGFQSVLASVGEHAALLEKHGWRGPKVSSRRAALLREFEALAKKQFQAAAVPWPEELDDTPFWAGKAIEFVRAHRGRAFFLHVNFRKPHHPFDPPAPYDRMYQDAAFPPSHTRPNEMDNKPAYQRKALESSVGFDLRTMTPRDLDRVKSYYYGMISENDKYIGLILEELRSSGLDARTLVVVTSDHGEMLGDHGLLFKGGYFYDEVLRVPLILRGPGIPKGQRVARLTEEIDVVPTVLESLGLPVPQAVQGRSLLREQKERPVHGEFAGTKMIRTRDWKLVHYVRAPHGELYNLREDPHELYNRYDDPAAAGQRHEMERALIDWLVDSQDPLLAPVSAGR